MNLPEPPKPVYAGNGKPIADGGMKGKAGLTKPKKHTTWWPKNLEEILRVAFEVGGTYESVAASLGRTRHELQNYAKRHRRIANAMRDGRAHADQRVVKSLFNRAVGYDAPDTDIRVCDGQIVKTPLVKHYPPSELACIFWLKNRKPDEWKDRNEPSTTVNVHHIDPGIKQLARELARERLQIIPEAPASAGRN